MAKAAQKMLTAREAAVRLNWTLDALYRQVWVGRIAGAEKRGKRWLIPEAAVEVRLERRHASTA